MSSAVLFPGQGTQQPGMGSVWQGHPAWSVVGRAEEAMGEPLAHLLLDASAELLARTREAQLAVLLTSLIAWEASRDAVGEVVAFAGHSLGQVTAMIAAGLVGLEDGVRFAARRAELTQAAADRHPGRMAALLGADVEQAAGACTAAPDACWVANDNAPGQVVIAGTPEGLEAATVRAKELGVRRVTALNVGGAFHTPLMDDAAQSLRDVASTVPLSDLAATIVANDDGVAHTGPDGWEDRMARHVAVPVRWRAVQETIGELAPTRLLEVGNGSMLAALAKRTIPDIPLTNVATPDDVAALGDAR